MSGEGKSRKSKFLASVVTLSAGSTLAQLITLGLMPFITRLYDPEAFGIFAVFVAIATVIISVSNLQLAEIIVITRDDADADAAAGLATAVVAGLSAVCALIALFFANPLAVLLGIQPWAFFLQFLAVAVFLGGSRQVIRRLLLREHRNRHIALGEVSQALVDRVASIAAFWLAPGTPIGLLVGRLLGQLAGVLAMLPPLVRRSRNIGLSAAQRKQMRELARSYSEFPRYSWAILLDNAAQQLPVLLLNALLGPAVAGGFALARRVLAEPAIILGAALAQSYYQLAAREEEPAALRGATAAMTFSLVKLIVLPIIVGLCCAPEFFAILFGQSWRVTGWYTLIVSPVFMLYLMLRPLNRIFDVNRLQREKGIYAAQNVAIIVASLLPALFIDNPFIVLGIYSAGSTLFLLYRGLWLLSRVGISPRDCLQACRLALLLAATAAIGCYLARQAFRGEELLLVAAVAAIVGLYLAALLAVDRRFRDSLLALRRSAGRKNASPA